jgi:hypothetical protein
VSGESEVTGAEQAFRQLCHVLSLDRTGKVQGAIEALVLTVLYVDPEVGNGRDPNEVATAISTYFGVTIDVGEVRRALEVQLRSGKLAVDQTQRPPGVVVAPGTRSGVAARITEASELEKKVREEWQVQVRALAPLIDPDQLWRVLQSYLAEVFRKHGVEAVQLLDAEAQGRVSGEGLQSILGRSIRDAGLNDSRDQVQVSIDAFFTEPTACRLRYLSQLLDGTFTFFALTVSDATADFLRGQLPPLRLFLDTNVALGLLGFQSSPQQEACVELVAHIKAKKLPFQLFYHERTLKELGDLADAATANLRANRYSPELSRAYVQMAEARGGASGIELHFHRMNAVQAIDVEAYVARFGHLEELLAELPAKIFRQNSELETDVKGRHIAEFTAFLEEHRPDRPRRYAAMDHDVVVWMSLQRQRQTAKSALRTGALLVSNDLALQSFDKGYLMRQEDGHGVPTVVLPQHLLQVLRPFDSGTPDFDRKFMEVFASPEFRTAQSDYDETSSRVMTYLASFEGVPTSTAVSILNDDLLMSRLSTAEANSEFEDLIESAVIAENAELVSRLTTTQARMEDLRAETERLSSQAEDSAKTVAQAEAKSRAAEAARAEAEISAAAERERLESVARDEKARREAEVEARLAAETELAAQRALIKSAQAAETRAEQARLQLTRRIRVALAIGSALAGVLLILRAPLLLHWDEFNKLETRINVQVLLSLIWIGVVYVIFGFKHRVIVLTTVVFGAVLSLVTLI